MVETVFDELKRYTRFGPEDEAALRAFHPLAAPELDRIAALFYARILSHDGARRALEGGESRVGRLKVTLEKWMHELLAGPWDDAYYERRCRIGRVHVKIALPQHYMFGAMDVIRGELVRHLELTLEAEPERRRATLDALGKILDLELAIMLHTYREDLLAHQARHFQERLAAVSTLTAGLSHEIRNPLNAAKLQLEVMERRVRRLIEKEAQAPLLEPHALVQDEIRRLDHLLEDFLQFARPRNFVPQAIELGVLLPKVLDLLDADADKRSVRVERQVVPGLAIAGDEPRLRQVLMNLLLNAMDAAGAGGWVRLSASASPEWVELVVEDSGPGIPPEMRVRIFEPFFTTKAAGSGLGLPIVNAIVTQHGGTISVASAEGGGARFVLQLPRAHSEAAAAVASAVAAVEPPSSALPASLGGAVRSGAR
jgi:signal transduction histidine kinase